MCRNLRNWLKILSQYGIIWVKMPKKTIRSTENRVLQLIEEKIACSVVCIPTLLAADFSNNTNDVFHGDRNGCRTINTGLGIVNVLNDSYMLVCAKSSIFVLFRYCTKCVHFYHVVLALYLAIRHHQHKKITWVFQSYASSEHAGWEYRHQLSGR